MNHLELLVKAAENCVSIMNDEDKQRCAELGYTVFKRPGPTTGSWVNATELKVKGVPSLDLLKNVMATLASGQYQVVWYSIGGKSQASKMPIKRVEFQHANEVGPQVYDETEQYTEMEEPAYTAGPPVLTRDFQDPNREIDRMALNRIQEIGRFQNSMMEAGTGGVISGFRNAMAAQADGFKGAISAQSDGSARVLSAMERWSMNVTEQQKLTQQAAFAAIMDVTGQLVEFSKYTLDQAKERHRLAFAMEENARRRDAAAQKKAGQAARMKAKAREALEAAERDLEEGKSDTLWSFVEKLVTNSDQGPTLMMGLADKVFSLIEKALGGGKDKDRIDKLGGIDVVANILQLNDTQKSKLNNLLQ